MSNIFKIDPLTHSFVRPNLILEKRNGEVIGKLIYENLSFNFSGKGVDEFSITIHKNNDGIECTFWDSIKDLAIINWRNFGRFVIDIQVDESNETTKVINCISLEGDELGQPIIRNLHINDKEAMTTLDPGNEFKPTYLYIKNDPMHSLLDRIINAKTKHWQIGHVDNYFNINGRVYKACNLQREFTIDGKSPYDVLEQEVAKECGCIFTYDTYNRIVNCYNAVECVFDTETMEVLDDIFYDLDTQGYYTYDANNVKIPVSGNYEYCDGIGSDTTIILTRERLSENVTVNSDKDSIKNCFYVTGGDDVITNYVASANASGNNYIYNFDYQYDLMSDALVQRLKSYKEYYKQKEIEYNKIGGVYVYDPNVTYDSTKGCYIDNHGKIIIDDNVRIVNNRICVLSPYSYYEDGECYNEDGTVITTTHTYDEPGLFIKFCQANDRLAYWDHNKFPNMTPENTTAEAELQKIKTYFQSNPLIITNAAGTNSFAHVSLLIKDMCNVITDNRYSVTVDNTTTSCDQINDSYGKTTGYWEGKISVVRDADKEDYDEDTIRILVKKSQNGAEDKDYCDQKIKIALKKMDISELPLTYNMSTTDNDNELREMFSQYNLTSLKGFRDSFDGCLSVLDDLQNQMLSTDDERQGFISRAFEQAFRIYKNRYNICVEYSGKSATERTSDTTVIGITEATVNKWTSVVDDYTNQIIEFQKQLSLETYLGNLYTEFLSFVREDEYNNGNYNSDGLSDSELLYRANELREVANAELRKASQIHYTLNGTINNIFNIDELKVIKDNFKIFNYVRYIADGRIFKLRLLGISGDENSLDTISVTFSDVISVTDMPGEEVKKQLDTAQAMSTTYSSTTLQARQGSSAYSSVDKMKTEGLNSAEYIIKNSNAEVIHDDHGSLYKNMDDTSVFSDNQLRITPAGMYLTDDAWQTTGMAVGTVIMTNPSTGLKQKYFGVIADYIYGTLLAGNGLEIANENGSVNITGDGIELDGGTIRWKNHKLSEDDVEGLTDDLSKINSTIIDITDDIKQLDGRIQTYSQSTLPSTSWTTTEEKDKHINDVWFNTATSSFTVGGVTYYPGETYVYTKSGNNYSWVITQDSILKGLAMSNATIFTTKPNKLNDVGYLYRKGDLWILGADTTVNSVAYKKDTILTATADNTTITFEDSDWIPVTTKAATDFASDSIITPGEKIQLKYTILEIDKEYDTISAQAGKYTVEITAYTTAYNALKTYINPILNTPNDNSDVVPATYQTKFSDYYTARKNAESSIETARQDYSDGVLETWVTNTFTPYQTNIQVQIDGKIQSYYQANAPYANKTNVDATSALDALTGDLWYETGTGKTYIYRKTTGSTSGKYNYTWTFEDVPIAVFDRIDGRKAIFLSAPLTDSDGDGYLYRSGDIWIISSADQSSSNTTVKNFAKQYTINTILASSVNKTVSQSFDTGDWTLLTTESAEQALSDIADMCNDGKLTGVEKIQTTRRLAEIDDEKAIYQAKKNAYSSNTSVTTAWSTYESKYNALKTQSANWALNSTTTTDITTASFTNYFTAYYSAKETLDAALEAASKKYAEDQAGAVQDNLTSFKSKVQGALMGNTTTEIGNDYVIAPMIGGGYLYIKNPNDGRSVTIDPQHNMWDLGAYANITVLKCYGDPANTYDPNQQGSNAYALDISNGKIYKNSRVSATSYGWVYQETLSRSNDYIFKITNTSGVTTIGADSDGNATFSGSITVGDTPSASTTGFTVNSSGLLKASNATIYGTIYATNGEFAGELKAATGTFSGNLTSSSIYLNSASTINRGAIILNTLTEKDSVTYRSLSFNNDYASDTDNLSISFGFRNTNTSQYTYTSGFSVVKKSGSIYNKLYVNTYLGNDTTSYIGLSSDTYKGLFASNAIHTPRVFAGNYVHGDYVLDVNGLSYFNNNLYFNNGTYIGALTGGGMYCSSNGYFAGNLNVAGVGVIKQLSDGGHQISMGWTGSDLQVLVDSSYFYIAFAGHNLNSHTFTWTSYGNAATNDAHNLASVDYVSDNYAKKSSDERIKKDFKKISDVFDFVFDELTPMEYRFKNSIEDDNIHIGDTAQHIERVLEKYALNQYGLTGIREICSDEEAKYINNKEFHYINQDNITWLCVDQIQKLKKQIDQLQQQIKELQESR